MASFETQENETSENVIETFASTPDAYMPPEAIEALIEDADLSVDPDHIEQLENPPAPRDYNLIKQSLTGLVTILGQIWTTRRDYEPLTPKDVAMLTDGIVNVMEQYPEFDPVGPKAMAWLGLSAAAAAIAQPRIQEKRMRQNKEIANDG